MQIRPFQPSDQSALIDLIAAFRLDLAALRGERRDPDPVAAAAELQEYLAKGMPVFVAERPPEEIVGYLVCRVDGEAVWAESLFVAQVLNELLAGDPNLVENAEALGLLALMLLHAARRPARLSHSGELILLEEQDRHLWDQGQIRVGTAVLDHALQMNQPGPYQIQAAIAALHDPAATPQQTDWPQIVALYQALRRYTSSPVVTLNWAVAVAMAEGPLRGLALLDDLAKAGTLDYYHLFHAARADLLRRAGFADDAHDAYSIALDLCQNSVEKRFLRRLAELGGEK
jgi:RNA polymerase sigma-70 factor, ECF subfamily